MLRHFMLTIWLAMMVRIYRLAVRIYRLICGLEGTERDLPAETGDVR